MYALYMQEMTTGLSFVLNTSLLGSKSYKNNLNYLNVAKLTSNGLIL